MLPSFGEDMGGTCRRNGNVGEEEMEISVS
jgi:hypothetical protein